MEKNKLPYRKNKNFKVPDGYFETLEDRIMDAVALNDEVAFLEGRKNSGFKVPENYFESFEAELFDKLEEKKTPKIVSLFNKEIFYYVAGAAAVFVAIVSTLFTNPAQPMSFEDLDMITLEGYLFETFETSNSDISQYLSEEEAYAAPPNQSDVDFEAVYEYLNENIEEPSILFNED